MLVAALLIPGIVFAECKEFKIVDHGDSVEAVCIGSTSTESERKAQRNEIRELESQQIYTSNKKSQRAGQDVDQKANLDIQMSEIQVEREKIQLEKERLRREHLRNDQVEDDMDNKKLGFDKNNGSKKNKTLNTVDSYTIKSKKSKK